MPREWPGWTGVRSVSFHDNSLATPLALASLQPVPGDNSGASRRENAGVCLKDVIARPMTGSAKQSTLTSFVRDGLLRFARNDGVGLS